MSLHVQIDGVNKHIYYQLTHTHTCSYIYILVIQMWYCDVLCYYKPPDSTQNVIEMQ